MAATGAAQAVPGPPGWKRAGDKTYSQAPWALAPQLAAAMREYGLQRRSAAAFRRAGRAVRLQVWTFADSRGAYGAESFLRAVHAPGRFMARQRWVLRAQGPLPPEAWRFWTRKLAGGAPAPLPLLWQQLPQRHQVAQSVGFAEGPEGLAALAPWLPSPAVNFAMEPLIATAQYRLHGAGGRAVSGQLAILSYPTLQIAAAQLRPIRASATMARRSGPLVIAWRGADVPAARAVFGTVHYRAIVTFSPPIGVGSLPGLILTIFVLIGFIAAVCLAAGLFAGGLRVLLAKWFPRRFALHPDRLIRLKLQ